MSSFIYSLIFTGGIARLGGQKSNRAFLPSIAEFYPSITLMGSQVRKKILIKSHIYVRLKRGCIFVYISSASEWSNHFKQLINPCFISN